MSEILSSGRSPVEKSNLAMEPTDYLTKYWGIISSGALVVFYGLWAYFKVSDHEGRIIKLEDAKEAAEKTISSLDVRLSAMDAKLDILVAGYRKEN